MPCCAHTGCQPQAMPQFPPVAQGQGSLEGLGVSFPPPHLSVCPRECMWGGYHTPPTHPVLPGNHPHHHGDQHRSHGNRAGTHPPSPAGTQTPGGGTRRVGGDTPGSTPPSPHTSGIREVLPPPSTHRWVLNPGFWGAQSHLHPPPGETEAGGGGTPPPRTPLPSTPALMQAAMGWALPSPASAAVPGTYPAGEGEESGWGGVGGGCLGRKDRNKKNRGKSGIKIRIKIRGENNQGKIIAVRKKGQNNQEENRGWGERELNNQEKRIGTK